MRQGFVEHLSGNVLLIPHRALDRERVTGDLVAVEVRGWPLFTESGGKHRKVDGRGLQGGHLSGLFYSYAHVDASVIA